MSRKSYWYAFVMTLLLALALVACGAQDGGNTETGVTPGTTVTDGSETNSGNEAVPTPTTGTGTTDTGNLPPLPGLSPGGGGGSGGGLGGGGGDALSSDGDGIPVEGQGADDLTMPRFFENRLENAQFNLNTVLPAAPGATTVWQQGMDEMTQEQMRDLANRFGFTGPLYTDPWYDQMLQDNPGIWPGPRSYYVFDGPRTLSFYGANLSYFDNGAMMNVIGWTLMPWEQARPLAEAFLSERGLLDFPYEVVPNPYGGDDVAFYRLVNGVRSTSSEISVSVTPEGNILSVYVQPFSAFTAVGDYPLISAEEAWQLVQGTPDYLRVFHNVYTDPATIQPYVDPSASEYRYWSRTYQNGEAITMYFYPTVYNALDGSAPLVRAGEFNLIASEADLQLMAANINQNIRLTGTVQGDTLYNQTIQVTSVQVIGDYQDWQSREGTIRRADGQTYLDTIEGETFIIPGAPADLPDGEQVYVNGPIIEAGEPFGTFIWTGIDRVVAFTEEPGVFDPGIFPTPVPIGQVNIDKVELVYTYSYTSSPDGTDAGSTWQQPAWRFTGTTDTGELVELLVQAVAPEYLQPAG